MKKTFLLALIAGATGLHAQQVANRTYEFPETRNVLHPGLTYPQSTFDRIKRQLAEGNTQTTRAYQMLTSNTVATQTWTWGPNEQIIRNSGGNFNNVARDGSVCLQWALRYRITDNLTYAQNAINILNNYARITKSIEGDTNMSLASGLYGYRLCAAAELLRDCNLWTDTDKRMFKQWLIDVWLTRCIDFLNRRHDTVEREGNWYHYESNWGAANALTVISIGIFCDDPAIYNQGVYYLKESAACESLGTAECNKGEGFVPWRFNDARGPYGELNMSSEFGRDQPHATLAIALQMYSAETLWNQGDNLWGFNDHILAGTVEHIAGWNVTNGTNELTIKQYDATNISQSMNSDEWPARLRKGKSWQGDWGGQRGRLTPAYHIAANHYSIRMLKPVPYTQRAADAWNGGYDGLTNINDNDQKDQLHYHALLFHDEPQAYPCTELTGKIKQNATTRNFPEISKVTKGTQLTLIAALPAGTANSGTWTWETPNGNKSGTTTTSGSELTITANASGFYRAVYTDTHGIKSKQLFSIAVYGDAAHHTTWQEATYNSQTYTNETLLRVPKGTSITFGLSNNGWSYGETYKWYINGTQTSSSTARTMSLTNISSSRTISVDVTNVAGAKRTFEWVLEVSDVSPYISVNDGDKQLSTAVIVFSGDRVKLWSEQTLLSKGGTSVWTNAAGTQIGNSDELFIEPTYSDQITLDYTTKTGAKTTWTFHIDVVRCNGAVNGKYLISDPLTGLYLTNSLLTDALCWADYNDSDPTPQTWLFQAQSSAEGRYKISSLADARIIYNTGILKQSFYFTNAYQTYSLYEWTGKNLVALQNGGKATPTWWAINEANIATDQAAQAGFPFRLTFLGFPDGIHKVGEDQPLRVYQDGNRIVMPEGAILYNIAGQSVEADHLPAGVYIVRLGNQSVKVFINQFTNN